MTKIMRLYPEVIDLAQDFSKEKIQTVPNQSLTLREIIKRFMRKEPLPVQQEGLYIETLGDLEKLARQDLTVRADRASELAGYIAKAQRREKEHGTPAPAKTPPPGGEASEPSGGGKGDASSPPLATL